MARTVLEVVVAGDSKSLERSMARSSKSVDKFGKDADKGLKKASSGFKGVSSAAKLAGGALASAGLLAGLKGIASAASESEKSTAKMRTQLKASGLSYKSYAGEIDRVIQKQSRLAALDDEDLQDAFTNIVRVTGDVSKSLKLVGLASDFARAKNIDVAKAGEIVGKVAGGNVGILARYGFVMEKGATATEALGQLQRKFGGQAEAYGKTTAGANDRFRVAVENLQEKLGAKLLPRLASVANGASRFVTQMENGTGAGGKFAAIVSDVAGAVGSVVGRMRDAVKGFRDGNASMVVLGGTMAGLVAGFVAFKVVTTVIAAMTALRAAVIGVNVAMRANPFVAVATVVAALGVALVVAYKKSETFRNVVDGVFRAVKKVAGDAISFILRAFDKYLGGLSSMLTAASKIPIIGSKFKGLAETVDKGRESIRSMADGLDRLGEKPRKVRVDFSEIDAAIRRFGTLKRTLQESDLVLTPRPRKDAGDIPGPPSAAGGLLGGLTAGARGVYSQVAQRFGGVRITSGFRTKQQNAAVGGRPGSDHLTGNAIDLVPTEGWNPKSISRFDKIAAWARSRGLWVGWRGYPGHGPGHHLHLSYRAKTALGQSRTMGDPKGNYDVDALKGLAMGAGLSESRASIAAAVAMAESRGNPRAQGRNSNGTVDRGLWQINSIHGGLSTFDVKGNARAMAKISRGGSNFQPWVAYAGPDYKGSDGPWRQFYAKARKAKPKKALGKPVAKQISGKVGSNIGVNPKLSTKLGIDYEGMPTFSGGDTGADVGGGGGGGVDLPSGDAQLDPLGAQLALAGLTKDSKDDLSVLGSIEQVLAGRLAGAQAAGDFGAIKDLATELKNVRDQIETLNENVKNSVEAQLAHTQALLELNQTALREEQAKARLGQTELGTLKNALAEIVNGTLGGRIGLGYQTVGFAGGTARY